MISTTQREVTASYIDHLESTGESMHIDNRARWNAIFHTVALRLTRTKPSAVKMFDVWDEQRAIAVADEHMVWMEVTIARIIADHLDPDAGWME